MHIDVSNLPGSQNCILPLCLPKRGGDLWVELGYGDVVTGPVVDHVDTRGKVRHGVVHRLDEDEVFKFDPKRYHFVTPFKGRVVIVGYTSDVLGKASTDDLDGLADLGFQLPDSVYLRAPRQAQEEVEKVGLSAARSTPANKGGGWEETFPVADGFVDFRVNWSLSHRPAQAPAQSQLVNSSQGDAEPVSWELFVPQERVEGDLVPSDCRIRCVKVLEGGFLSPALEEGSTEDGKPVFPPQLCKTEPTFTKDIETFLASLTSPLQIVHTVDPAEVALHPIPWIPSIKKELGAVEHAVLRLPPSDPKQAEYLKNPRLQVVPSKFVFTVKPPEQGAAVVGEVAAAASQKEGLYRRKARIVACGNAAPNTGLDVYAGGAQAERLRTVIALASFFGWLLGCLDITSAFLKTPIPDLEGFPIFALTPPRLLIKLGLAVARELWILSHAVYGLREAPRLWGQFRDSCLCDLSWECDGVTFRLEQSSLDPNWWKVLQVKDGQVVGALLVYVEDFLLCGSSVVLRSLAQALQHKWATTHLVVAMPEQPIKFLGVDILVVPRGFVLSQQSYAEEVLRIHSVPVHVRGRIPCPRELASFEVVESDAPPTSEAVHQAQQVTGALLWLSQRSRPDLAFTCSLSASLATKAPHRALRIADRALGYLQRTKSASLVFVADSTQLHGWSDASFSPEGSRSHAGWCVCLHGCPIAWRSARQAFVTLSTAESELMASLECAVALESMQALLLSVGFSVEDRELHVDSQAPLAISDGHGSWRTRHLRVRAEYLREQTKAGKLKLNFCPGVDQLADLLTKALPAAGIEELCRFWGMTSLNAEEATLAGEPCASAAVVDRVALCALLCLLQIPSVEGTDQEEVSGLQVDGSIEFYFFAGMAGLCLLVVWEWLKKLWDCLDAWWAGSQTTSRRARRLRRMQRAIEDELASQLQGMTLDDQPCVQEQPASSATLRGEPCTAPPVASQPAVRVSNPSRRRPSVREQEVQTDPPAFRRLTETRTEPPMPPRIIMQPALHNGPYFVTQHGECVHTNPQCWGLRNATSNLARKTLCHVCADEFCQTNR